MSTSRLNNNSLLFTSDGSTQISKLTASNNVFTFNGASGTCRLTGLTNPVNDADSATKSYVDSKINGVTWKNAVTCSTTGNIDMDVSSASNTLEGSSNGALPAQDGVTLEAGERVLVKDQTDSKYNGIYTVTTAGDASSKYLLTRTEDSNSASELQGAAVFVQEGSTHSDTGWVMSSDSITLNTTALTWSKFSHTGGNVAGSGITVDGREISIQNEAITNAMLAGSILADKLDGNIPDSKIAGLSATKLTGIINNDRLFNVPASKLNTGEGLEAVGDKTAVAYDDTTISISSNQLHIKDDGVNTAQIANDAINGDKLKYDIVISTSGSITATTFTASSDKRLKENIEDVDDALDKVCAMEGVTYNFKANPEEKRAGVIAQDLENVCPELVQHDSKGMLSVNYIDIIPYLIESIKELKEMVTKK